MAQWGRIRQSYMAGKSYKELSEKYGISVKTIQNRASKEGWVKEKGKFKEEVGEKIHERVVRVRVRELEKLMDANGKLIDTLVTLTERAADDEQTNLLMFDKAGSMKNVECLAKAIQTAVQTQRDLYKLPTLDQEYKRTEIAIKSLIQKEQADMAREKWEAEKLEKEKERNEASEDKEIWKIISPEGEVLDG
jgi:hypothetical protein